MLDLLDATLKKLLELELPRQMVSREADTPVAISFATPDDEFPAQVTLPAIDLFLYDVRENRELRSNEWIVERQSDGTATKKRPPARVDCSYLVTAWSNADNAAEQEHLFLGEVMKVLLRHPSIPAAVLQGSLEGQEPPLPTTSLQPGRLQSLGEFWQALGGKPKAALNYTVTIGVEAHAEVETAPPVTDKRTPGRREES